MLETNRRDYYFHLKSMINQHDQEIEQDISKYIHFINKIKEHRHSKIKAKHIHKFDHLYFKRFGYHHNFTRNTQNLDNFDQNNALSGQSNMPSNVSITSPNAIGSSTVPATPMASTPSSSIHPAPLAPTAAPGHQPSSSSHTCKTTNYTKKWVFNLSKNPLTTEQLSLLQKGPNFAITTKYPPIEAYITAVEEAAFKLPSMEADELGSDISNLLRHHKHQHNNHSNFNPVQCRALTQLKQDTSRVVLTADKGVAMVIMDKQEYTNKVNTLLQDTKMCTVLNKDPTTSLKNKLITTLRSIKQTEALSIIKYKHLYPTSAVPSKFYGLPKIHKVGTPSDPFSLVGTPLPMG